MSPVDEKKNPTFAIWQFRSLLSSPNKTFILIGAMAIGNENSGDNYGDKCSYAGTIYLSINKSYVSLYICVKTVSC